MLALALLAALDFATLAKLYRYDASAPLEVKLTRREARPGYTLYDISYAGPMSGYLVVPDAPGRKPAIVWMHSGGPLQFLGNAVLMARAGAVSLLTGYAGKQDEEAPEQFRDVMIRNVVGLRRAVDVLSARADVDPRRIALVGHSFGAMMGAVAVSVDPRFRAAVFEGGLLGMSIHIGASPHPWAAAVRKDLGPKLKHYLEVISVVDAVHYIGHAPAIPKLFQSAWFDPGVPHKDSEDFFRAATGPKQLRWYDTGHDIDDPAAIADRASFLADALKLPHPKIP